MADYVVAIECDKAPATTSAKRHLLGGEAGSSISCTLTTVPILRAALP
jgi:hypothetical protein